MFNTIKDNLKKYPLVWYYILSVSIVIILIPIFLILGLDSTLSDALDKHNLDFNTSLVLAAQIVILEPATFLAVIFAILQVASPDIAIIILSFFNDKNYFNEIKQRIRFARKGLGLQKVIFIWVSCILIFCLMNISSAGLHYLFIPKSEFVWNVNFNPIVFIPYLLVAMFLDAGGLFEENGWRGFVLPLLQKRYYPVTASLILGVLWSFWHIPVKINLLFEMGLVNFVLIFGILTLKFIFLSIIMTYFFNKLGESTIIAIVMHGLSNDSIRLGGNVVSENFFIQLINEINLTIPMLLVALALIYISKGKLGFEGENKNEAQLS